MTVEKKTSNITIRMPSDLFEWLTITAEEQNRSINGQVIFLLRQAKAIIIEEARDDPPRAKS